MTLKTRNRIFFVLLVISTLFLIASITAFTILSLMGKVSFPQNTVRTFSFLPNIFKYQAFATIADIYFFSIYVPIVTIFIYIEFKNTQSLEIIYFTIFLIGCLLESIRISLPLYGIWQTNSTTLIIIGRIILAGRIMAFLGMLFASLFSRTEDRQNIERNYLLCIIISLLLGITYPLNTLFTTSTWTVLWANTGLFTVLRIGILMTTVVAMIIPAFIYENEEAKHEFLGYIIMMLGYLLLCTADTYTFVAIGILMLSLGTVLYLRALHKAYLWS